MVHNHRHEYRDYTRVCRFYKKQFSAQSPAVDVMGVGLSSGRILLHDIRADKTLMSFSQDWGPVTTLSFRTGKT